MRIQELMRQRGITQEMVAQGLGITKQGVNIMLNGENPKLSTLERIAAVIGVPVYQLFVNPDELSEVSGPSVRVDCPHCGSRLEVTMPVRINTL